ncbi:MAG TPA: molybdopterin-binding protein, partial [Sphingomicrobium sp.]|nr:molybdopterin-binding protein [Sphingomicrobium sp.]
AMVRQWGGECVARKRLPDDPGLLESAAEGALGAADLVVVTGGASVGEKDYSRSMFGRLGLELIFLKVAIKPGKPVWLGRSAGRLILGLPGNPTSALVTARLFLAPLLLKLGGAETSKAWNWVRAPLFADLAAGGARETFLRACWNGGAVCPLSDQDSGAQRALAKADVLVRRGVDAPALGAGELATILDF